MNAVASRNSRLFKRQTSDIKAIEGHITTLQNSLNALSDPAGALTSMATSSSNSAIVTRIRGELARWPATTLLWSTNWHRRPHGIPVLKPAAAQLWPRATFNIQVGSGSPITVTTGSGVNTLDQVVSYINGLGAGVTASVVNDASGSRLALVSTNSGAANNFTVTGGSGLTFTQATTGKDASLTVDGIPIDSASNTVTGAVNGLTFNLTGASPGTQVNVSVAADTSQVAQAINSFVSAYNTVIGDVNTEYTVNGTQEGALAGDAILGNLQSVMLAVGSFTNGGTISNLGSLGISMNHDGTLTVDSAKLNDAIQNNSGAVQSFLQGASSNGFAATLNTQLNTFVDPVSGAFTVDLQSNKAEITDLQNQINDFQTYITSRQTYLTNEYNQADVALQQLPILEQQLNAELGYTTTKSGS